MESPLSFNSSENFRKKLLVRNLQPYKVEDSFAGTKLENKKEIVLIDYSVKDSDSLNVEQKNQEKKLIGKNKYTPYDGFGDVIDININTNSKTNLGEYGQQSTILSELVTIGNTNEKLLYVKNLYGPTEFSNTYGNTIDINKNLFTKTNLGKYSFDKSVGSQLEIFGITKEIELIVQNQYSSPQDSVKKTVDINKNNQTKTNVGEYGYNDTLQSLLQTNGIVKKQETLVVNQYTPVYPQSNSTIDINKNRQFFANQGNYSFDNTVGSLLEKTGDELEVELRKLNKYNPENIGLGYGNVAVFPLISTDSNFGEYDYVSNGPSITTLQSRTNQYVVNIYGPQGGYINQVNISADVQSKSNQGEYQFTASRPPQTEQQQRNTAYVSNLYGPEDLPNIYGNIVDIDINNQTDTNRGEYDYTASLPEKTTEQSQQYGYLKNKFVNGQGEFELLTIEELFPSNINAPYYNSTTSFFFLASTYSPLSILEATNPAGSNGRLSQDSDLAKLGAKQLNKEFKARVAIELYQQTLGSTILSNTSVSNQSGEISVKPSVDPFDILGVVTNNVPLIQKNYKITTPGIFAPESLTFQARLAGLYSPYSIIPGEYFDYPNRNFLSQALANPIGAVVSGVGGLLNNIATPFIDSGSETLLANTSNEVKNLLFDQLFYNQFRPNYNQFGGGANLVVPLPNFYVGRTKNFISDVVSPANEIANGAYGKKNEGPVFDYGVVGQEYEGNEVQRKLFGLKSYPYYDAKSGVIGGLTWMATRGNYVKPGVFVGPGNETYNTTESSFDANLRRQLNDTDTSKVNFTDGSLLDITQKLVEAGSKSSNPKGHVGNAINQISKVFNDGYIEMTKGSRVRRYLTPTAVQGNNKVRDVVGFEYARLFTKDRPYFTYAQLQKTDGNIRKSSYSVLDKTYNLNIAPMKSGGGIESTNIKDGQVKKYMLSIENLAWASSNRPGYTVEDLPVCERGPNGGRVMWFPPYELSYDDTSRTEWKSNTFLGRTEPIYTYQNTERTGKLGFFIVVDHPSVMNILVNKELEKADASLTTQVVDSFIAGCTKYDIYDLLKKYKQFSLSDVYSVISSLDKESLKNVVSNLPPTETTNTVETSLNTNSQQNQSGSSSEVSNDNVLDVNKYQNINVFFDKLEPPSDSSYESFYQEYIGNETILVSQASNLIYDYAGTVVTSPPQNFSLETFVDSRTESIQQVFGIITDGFSKLKEMCDSVLTTLKSGAEVVIKIEGTRNLLEQPAGIGLTRANSVKTFIETYQAGDDRMSKFLETTPPLLRIETTDLNTPTIDNDIFRNIDCSKPFPNSNLFQNTVQGMMCRSGRVSIKSVTPNNQKEGTNVSDEQPEGELPNETAADNNNPNNTQPQSESSQNVKKSNREDKTNGLREGLTKRLLRKLLSECDYFEMIAEQYPMIYDGIKSKIKNFQPAFHSMTPEGLNSRITFLQQCMRPGDTIPTAVQTNEGGTELQYNDVINSAFGSPPVCVIRVGDMYNCKVVFDNLDLTYDEAAPFDLNPEGVGVQPMVVKVSLSFKMIGGHGLKGPIESLQNALSFNYYANTEMYDERAEETEPFTSKYDVELFDIIKNEIGDIGNQKRPTSNDGGVTIGIVQNTFINPQTENVEGTIRYKEVMNILIDKTQEYVNGIYTTLQQIKENLLWGGLVIYNSDRLYSTGLFDYLTGGTPTVVNIYGKPNDYQDKVNAIFDRALSDVDNDLCPLIGGITQIDFSESDIRKVKKQIKKLIKDRKNSYLENLESNTTKLVQSQIELIKYIDQINYVLSGVDAYKNKSGSVTVYSISGTSDTFSNSTPTPTDTFDELRNDFIKIGTDLNLLDTKFKQFDLIQTGATQTYNNSLDFNLGLLSNAPEDNVFYMIFGKELLERETTLQIYNSIISTIPDSATLPNWETFLWQNLGYDDTAVESDGFPTQIIPDGLYSTYKKTTDNLNQNYKKFFDEYFNINFPNSTYTPFSKEKERVFDLSSQLPPQPPNDTNFLDLWSKVDKPGNDFNLKKKMN